MADLNIPWTPDLIDTIAESIRSALAGCVGGKIPTVTWTLGMYEWEEGEGGTVHRTPDGSLRILIEIPPDRLSAQPVCKSPAPIDVGGPLT